MSGFSWTCLLFESAELCAGEVVNLQKIPGFWCLLIVTLNFSVVSTNAVVRSFRRPRFDYLFLLGRSGSEGMLVQPSNGRPFLIICSSVEDVSCAV